MSDALREELRKLRDLLAQTRAMGLEVIELEDRVAEIERELAREQQATAQAAVSPAAGTLQILTPHLGTGDWGGRPVVLVGGGAETLPQHRAEVMEVCAAQGLFPITVERWPAADAEAVHAAQTIADNVHLYIGLFAYRYGRVPGDYDISLAEIVYDRVVARGIPRLIFFMDKKHPVTPQDIERGEGAAKLAMFKARLREENAVHSFVSAADLCDQLVEMLRTQK